MIKAITAMIATTAVTVGIEAWACSCQSPPDPGKALQEIDVVIAGKVIASAAPGQRPLEVGGETKMVVSDGDMVRWSIQISLIWKGKVADTVAVYSNRGPGMCGYHFKIGEEYLIYADSLESDSGRWLDTMWPGGTEFPVLITSSCTRTRRLQDAIEDLSQLHKPRSLQ